jgi:hypothetical protein
MKIGDILAGVLLSGVMVALMGSANATVFDSTCPNQGITTNGCNIIITLNPNGTGTVTSNPLGPRTFDGTEDTLVGVINNSGKSVGSITLSANTNIFAFLHFWV